KLIREHINKFERGLDPKEAMGTGDKKERLRQKHIQDALKNLAGKDPIGGLFRPDYILTKESSNKEINKFIKSLSTENNPKLLKLLIQGLKTGFVTVIMVSNESYFYWQTIEDGFYDPGDLEVMDSEILRYIIT
ncbi:MAG: hypothetical protein WC554_13545, partial [Clostridia bacterium]